jgi:hypothetical protein
MGRKQPLDLDDRRIVERSLAAVTIGEADRIEQVHRDHIARLTEDRARLQLQLDAIDRNIAMREHAIHVLATRFPTVRL